MIILQGEIKSYLAAVDRVCMKGWFVRVAAKDLVDTLPLEPNGRFDVPPRSSDR